MQDYQQTEFGSNLNGIDKVISEETTLRTDYRVYRRRWLILILFVLYSMSNAMQWIQYSIISNVIVQYYGVSSFAVDWTSMIYMVTYIPLIFPASWLLDKLGIRVAIILGAIGNCAGSWIKVLALDPSQFGTAFIGQTVSAISQIFILSLPSRLAAVWFGQDEVSLACSIGVFGNQLGIAIGFVIPPMIVKWSEDISVVRSGLALMYYSVAGLTTAVLVLIVFFLDDKPKLPPSPAQVAQQLTHSEGGFGGTVKRLLSNVGFVQLLVSYGINVGVFYAISTLLNTVILLNFPGEEENAGRIGLTIVFTGMLGSVVCGYILDKTRLFKETTLVVYIFSVLGMLAYTFTLGTGSILVVYITAGLLGFFMTGYLPVGFELAAELTYPESEGTSAGLINAGAQIFGIAFTSLYGWLIPLTSDVWANTCLIFMLFIGTILTAFIPSVLRRQKASEPL